MNLQVLAVLTTAALSAAALALAVRRSWVAALSAVAAILMLYPIGWRWIPGGTWVAPVMTGVIVAALPLALMLRLAPGGPVLLRAGACAGLSLAAHGSFLHFAYQSV